VSRRFALTLSLAVLGAACGGNPKPGAPGPQTPGDAVSRFMTAVLAKDVDRLGTLWGTERGPASEWMDPKQLHERVTVIQKYLTAPGYRLVEGPLLVPGEPALKRYRVELQRQDCNRVVPIDVIQTRRGDWLVTDVHLESAGTPGSPCSRGTSP